jgi:hypothetical protein
VTILGRGDLAPARRHRRRWPRVLALLVVLGVLGGAGWEAYRLWQGDSSPAAVAPPCTTPTPPPAPAAASEVTLRVLNGTRRTGLAHDVAKRLRHRGFHVRSVGNNPAQVRATVVTYPDGALPAALAVADQLRRGATAPGGASVVTLVLGRNFHGLASHSAAKANRARDERAASPSASPCPGS